ASSHSSAGSRRPLPQRAGSVVMMVGISGRASVLPVEPPAAPPLPVWMTPVPASGSSDRAPHAIAVAANKIGSKRSQDITPPAVEDQVNTGPHPDPLPQAGERGQIRSPLPSSGEG